MGKKKSVGPEDKQELRQPVIDQLTKIGDFRDENRSVESLIPYARNSRKHSDESTSIIMGSIRQFGFTNRILIDEENNIIAGHNRLKACQRIEITEVPCRVAIGWTETQKKAYVILDNQSAVHEGTTWDIDILQNELVDLTTLGFDMPSLGFTEDQLKDIMQPLPHGQGQTPDDEIPPVPADAITKPGDVWICGAHAIICDSNESGLARLMGETKAHLVITSPPYNQSIDKFSPSGMHKEGDWVSKVQKLAYQDSMPEREYQDSQREFLANLFLFCAEKASVFYNHKNRYRDKRVVSPLEWLPGLFVLRQEIIWRRPGSVTQNARMFLPSDERIYWLYKGDDFAFNDETEIKSWSSIWDINLETNKSHPVAFPTELPMRCIRACSMPDDIVLDPYGGSGTVLIACEKTKRRARLCEKSPHFTDVAITRWQNWTGEEAILEGDGRTFQECARDANIMVKTGGKKQ